jgi:hypothetical protein
MRRRTRRLCPVMVEDSVMTVAVECVTEVESPAAGEDDHYSTVQWRRSIGTARKHLKNSL